MKIAKKLHDKLNANNAFARKIAVNVLDYFLNIDKKDEQAFRNAAISNNIVITNDYNELFDAYADLEENPPEDGVYEDQDGEPYDNYTEAIELLDELREIAQDSENDVLLRLEDDRIIISFYEMLRNTIMRLYVDAEIVESTNNA